MTRYSKLGAVADFKEAIEIAREMSNMAQTQMKSWHSLGHHLAARYLRTGDLADFDQAISFTRNNMFRSVGLDSI
jgi:hypothetical protein